MKRFKKLSVAIVVLAMCALLGISVWAANWLDVTYTATFDKPTLCITGADQTVTLTVKTNTAVEMDSLTASVTSDLEISSVTFGALTGAEWNSKTGMIMWYSADAKNVTTDTLAVVTVKVPANVSAGSYNVKFEIVDISANDGNAWETGETITATLTVAEHQFTATSDRLASAATCDEPASYYAKCVNCGKVHETLAIEYGTAIGHAYPDKPTTYEINGDTHTAKYVCGNNTEHIKADPAEEHTYDQEGGTKCICGAEKPATGLKGDVDLDGDVDIDDLTYLAEHVAKIITITNATSLDNAEVTGDGAVTIDDLTKLAEYVAKIIPSLD